MTHPIEKKAMKDKKRGTQSTFLTSLLLFLLAIIAITVASRAWISISDNTKLRTVGLEVTLGNNLLLDTAPHESSGEYLKELSFQRIAEFVRFDQNYDMETTPLSPVTTSDCQVFTYEDGTVVDPASGAYWEFTLHFYAQREMLVHLTSANGEGQTNGTAVESRYRTLPSAMRISFTSEDGTAVYDPGANISQKTGNFFTFHLPNSNEMAYNDSNVLFSIQPNEDKPVTVRIWMEGTDPACEDSLKSADFSIRLRFQGTDQNNQPFTDYITN